MDRTKHASPVGLSRSLARSAAGLLAVVLLTGTAFAACSGADDPAAGATSATTAATPMAAMPTMSGNEPGIDATPMAEQPQSAGAPGDLMPADASTAWAARPAYTKVDARTEEAYAYALYHPQVIQWMPCYCGCGGMGHQSNLDCYLKPALPGMPTTFEEHASFCEICVDTTLLAKQLISEGKSLSEIRAAVDQTFGGSVPGTPTDLPPA
jgi:hypothetical protein